MSEFKPGTWYPISTAPKDGTEILLWFPKFKCVINGFWDTFEENQKLYETWYVPHDFIIPNDPDEYPTHWMPLPAPPEGDEG